MQENIKNSTLQVIDHAGHLSNLENPEVFNHHLKMFLDLVYKEQLNVSHTSDNSILRDLRSKLNMLISFRPI